MFFLYIFSLIFLVAGCEIEPKGCLEIVLLVRNEIIFVYFTSFSCFNIAIAERPISGGEGAGLVLERWCKYVLIWPVYWVEGYLATFVWILIFRLDKKT